MADVDLARTAVLEADNGRRPTFLMLTVLVEECRQWHHRPVYTEIVHRAHKAGLAGATVLRGLGGFGVSGHLHTISVLSLSQDVPVSVVMVDEEARIRAFLPQLDDVVEGGMVFVREVEVVHRGRRRG